MWVLLLLPTRPGARDPEDARLLRLFRDRPAAFRYAQRYVVLHAHLHGGHPTDLVPTWDDGNVAQWQMGRPPTGAVLALQ